MAANTDMAGKPGYDENGNILMAISSVAAGVGIPIGSSEFYVSGTLKSHIMIPTDSALVGPATDSATKMWTGTCKAYRVKALAAITATHAVVHASSTTANDDLSGLLNTADTNVTTGTGAALSGVVVQTTGEEIGSWIMWDGSTTIKTITMRLSVGATPGQVILETIE